jgi:F-type H+-transporting ATPase subunit a
MNARRLLIIAGVLAGLVLLMAVSLFVRAVPQPIIEIKGEILWEIGPLQIRNTTLTMWLVGAFLIVVAFFSGRALKWLPGGWQNFIEAVCEGIYNLCASTAGEVRGRRFFWVIATFFFFIALGNWFALLPFFNVIGKTEKVTAHHFHEEAYVVEDTGGFWMVPFGSEIVELEVDESPCEELDGEEKDHCVEEQRQVAIDHAYEEGDVEEGQELAIIAPYFRSMNTDLMTPLALAVTSMIFVEYWGISTLGFFSYMSRFFNFGALRKGPMGLLDFFVGLLEFVAELVRLVSFSFRLFGNMLAGEILLLVMSFLLPFTFVIVGVFYGLEIFVGAIQAFIFGMLTLVFAVMATTGHGDGDHADEGH